MMSEQQQARFDAVCREIDEHLFEHSVLSGIDEGVMSEYVGIIGKYVKTAFGPADPGAVLMSGRRRSGINASHL